MSEKKCPSCGATVDINSTECKYCGGVIENSQQQQQYQTNNNQQTNTQYANVNLKYAYLKPYYQEQFQKIENSGEVYKGKWNWCAFFFTWIWALTKGLWGIAIATIVVSGILAAADFSYISLVICILFGVRGNYFYYNLQAKNKQFPNTL